MTRDRLDIVILGLSITSSWGNGHATTYRGLVKALSAEGHRVLFLERDVPWYAENRDLPDPPYCAARLYRSLDELRDVFVGAVRAADLVVVGSFVPDGIAVADWVLRTARGHTAFYDIDTPATVAALQRGDVAYVSRALVPRFDLYLSFTGGPMLERLERELGAAMARPLYCSFDPEAYQPVPGAERRWDLGYMGTYSADRQPALERLMLEPARVLAQSRFVVAGPLYPEDIVWPSNVQRTCHLAPGQHREFYASQRFTLNLTRADMIRAGYSPSVRLFEAAACAVPIVSDEWSGLEAFFEPGRDILVARTSDDIVRTLAEVREDHARQIGERGRERVLARHTAAHRAAELCSYVSELRARQRMKVGAAT